MTDVLAQVQEQMADLAAVQRKQAELTASSTAADGLVEVTVNAHGHLTKTVIDEAYLDEFEFEELSGHITEAAQAAIRTAATQIAEMMAPILERRQTLPGLSEIFDGAPDLRDLAPPGFESSVVTTPRADPDGNDGTDESPFPTVRR
jgi:DNA-binding protein YbaB